MNKLQITIDTNTAAFDGMGLYSELRDIFDALDSECNGEQAAFTDEQHNSIEDSHGNTVGAVKWTA